MSDPVLAASRASIEKGSSSFAAAARLLPPAVREDAYHLYAWCRRCDDEIDGQELGHGSVGLTSAEARLRLDALEALTRSALAGERMDDPAFDAFQRVARGRGLAPRHPLELLEGFRMDVDGRVYRTFEDTLEYAYHVAGVVGVMMAEIMGVRQSDMLARAADLGLAFQLTNIARDVLEDARGGRVYLPQEWLGRAIGADAVLDPAHRDEVFAATSRLVLAAEPYYASARWGLQALGFRSAWAIASALGVYREIGLRVRAGGALGLERRASTSSALKLLRVAEGFGVALRAVTLDRRVLRPEAPALFRSEGLRSAALAEPR